MNKRPQSERRRISRQAKRDLTKVETKKKRVTEELSGKLGADPFAEIRVLKSFLFGLVTFQKSGLVIAPTRTWKMGNVMVRTTVDSLILAGFGYVFKVKDWRVRSNTKPKEAKGNYIFTLNKYISYGKA